MGNHPKYIQDKPKGIDLFEGGSQISLSKVIAKHILETDNDKGECTISRIIGIEGSWGSGKSNVVKLVEKELGDPNHVGYHFFEYDAWGNQEDLQRRSFLEQLTKFLIKELFNGNDGEGDVRYRKIIDKWNKKLEELLSHKRETFYETFPALNWGVIAIALTPVTTLLATILGTYIPVYVEVIIAIFPLLFAFADWLFHRNAKSGKITFKRYFTTIFIDRARSEHNIETIYDKEPNVVMFREWMQDLSNDFESEGLGKLIIIFDNMDRLPADKVKGLWSSIHTFFSGHSYDNIWVIIPFDREHLSRAFMLSSNNSGEASEQDSELTQKFIDKTFPITYCVTKPLITDYKGIFSLLFNEAFGDVEKENEFTINRLYRLKNPEANIREIIIFINRLVTLYKTNHKDIRLINMAIYQLNKVMFDVEPNEHILKGDYLGEASRFIDNDENLQTDIAALVYGVGTELASQIPLQGYLKECIDNKPEHDINKYSSMGVKFDAILSEVCLGVDAAKLPAVIANLNILKRANDSISKIWENVAVMQLREPLKEQPLSDSYQKLLSHVAVDTQRKLINHWYTSIQKFEKLDGAAYVTSIKQIRETCGNEVESCIRPIDVRADVFIEALAVAMGTYKEYKLKCSPDEVDKEFKKRILAGTDSFDLIWFLKRDGFCDFLVCKNAIEGLIENESKVNENNVGEIFNIYRLISSDKIKLAKKLSQQRASSLMSKLKSQSRTGMKDGYIDLIAMSIENGSAFEIAEEQQQPLAEIFEYYIQPTELLSIGLTRSNSSLNAFIKYIIVKKIGKSMDLKKVLPSYYKIKNTYRVEDKELLGYLNRSHLNLNAGEMDFRQLQSLIPDASFYKITTTSVHNKLTADINQLALEVFSKSVTFNELCAIKNYTGSYHFKLINNLIIRMEGVSIPLNIIAYSKWLLKEFAKNTTGQYRDEYNRNIMVWIDGEQIADVFPEIRDIFCNGKGDMTPEKFNILEENLREYGELSFRSSEVVNRILKPIINDKECKPIILENADFYKNIIESSEHIDDFINFVSARWPKADCLQIGINAS